MSADAKRSEDPGLDPILTVEEAARLVGVRPIMLKKSDCRRIRHSSRTVRFERKTVLLWYAEARKRTRGLAIHSPEALQRMLLDAEVVTFSHRWAVARNIVYALTDPRTPWFANYIGQTTTPLSRYAAHCHALEGQGKRGVWYERLLYAGLIPRMVLIEQADDAYVLNRLERLWIMTAKSWGHATENRGMPHESET